MSQQTVSDAAGLSQSMTSRLERALAPAMGVDRLVALAAALGHHLPLGFCPHEHACPWQPLVDDPAATAVRPAWDEERHQAVVELASAALEADVRRILGRS